MAKFEEVLQELRAYNLYESLNLEPATVPHLFTSNRVQRVLGHLFGQYRGAPKQLASSSSGELQISDTAAAALLTTLAGLVHLEDDTHTTADPGVQSLAVRQDARAPFGADGDYSPLQVTATGDVRVRDDDLRALLMSATYSAISDIDSAVINVAAGATGEIVGTPGAGARLLICGLAGTTDTADATVVLKTAATAKTGAMSFDDNGGLCLPVTSGLTSWWFHCATNEAFNLTTVTGAFKGICSYRIGTLA